MPLSPEQKKRVQERATELIAQGVSTVEAVDKAFQENVGPDAFNQALLEKTWSPPLAQQAPLPAGPVQAVQKGGPQPLPTDAKDKAVALSELDTKRDLAKAQAGLALTKPTVVQKKGEQISGATGVPSVVAEDIAARSFEELFNVPMGKNWGETVAEKKPGKIIGPIGIPEAGLPLPLETEDASLYQALRPRSYLPKEQYKTEPLPPKNDFTWGNVYDSIREAAPDLSTDEAGDELRAIKAAFDVARANPKNAGKSGQQLLNEVYDDLRQINYKISNKSTWRKDPNVPQEQKGLMTDPLYAAFQQQTKAGEGFPDLSPMQITYLTTQKNQRADKRLAQLKKDWEGRDIIDTEELPGPGGTTKVVQKKLEGAERDERLRQMAEQDVAIPFWADQQKLEQKLSTPPAFALMSQQNPYGTTQESNLGWLMRSAMVVPNVFAGAVFPQFFIGSGQTRQDVLAERKERRPQAYKESPILLNVAEGRGFVGEAVEAADIMGLAEIPLPGGYGNLGQVYTAGAFAADMLDPSLDVIAGTAMIPRVALQTYKGAKAAGLTPSVGKALARGAAEGAKEAVSTSALLSMGAKAGGGIEKSVFKTEKLAKALEPGDLRFWLADQIGGEVAVANEVKKAIETGGDVQLIISRNPKSEFAKQWATAAGTSDAEKFANVRQGAKYLDTALDNEGRFNNFVSGAPGQSSGKEVIEALSGAAVKDRAIASKVADVLKGKEVTLPPQAGGGIVRSKGNTSDLLNLVRTDADVRNAVRSEIVGRGIINEVYKNTADVNAFDNYVRVTKNTWATPQETQRLMESFKSSDFGKTVADLNKLDVSYGKSAINYNVGRGFSKADAEAYKAMSPAERSAFINKSIVVSGGEIAPGVRLTPEQQRAIVIETEAQRAYKKVPQNYKPAETDPFISFKDLRKLIDNRIDINAAASKGAVDAGTLKNLAPRQSLDITIPVEARSFTHSKFKDFWDSITSKTGVGRPANLKLPAPQRAAINDLTGRLSKADVMLRNEITKMNADAAYREAVTGSKDPISRSASVAYAAFPKGKPFSYAQTEKVLRDTANSMLITDATKEDVFNVFNGLTSERTNDIWSVAGRAQADKIIGELAFKISEGKIEGDAIWQAIRKMHDDLASLTSQPGMLKDPEAKITDIVAKSGAQVVPPELLVSTYYRAEAQRAIGETMRDIIDNTSISFRPEDLSPDSIRELENIAGRVEANINEKLNTKIAARQQKVAELDAKAAAGAAKRAEKAAKFNEKINKLKSAGKSTAKADTQAAKIAERSAKLDEKAAEAAKKRAESIAKLQTKSTEGQSTYEIINNLIEERLKTVVLKPDVLKEKGLGDEALLAFGDNPSKPILDVTNPATVEILEHIDDTAKSIADVNGFKTASNIEQKTRNIRRALNNPDVYNQAKIVFGEDIAAQLKGAFAEGGSGSINQSIEEAMQKYTNESSTETLSRWGSSFAGRITDLFYTGILTAAPRFHGGNILGAPGLIYSTTGKLPDPLSAVEAIEVAGRAGTSLGDTAKMPRHIRDFWGGGFITDAAGRKYTPNELWEAFSTGAGESTTSLGLSSVQQRSTLRQLEAGKIGSTGRALDIIKRTPQTEDVIWRMAVGIEALKQGRSLEEAKMLAKAALYDAGDITEAEKKLQKLTMFYSFTRNNFVNLLKNMTDPGFWKRIAKAGAAKRGADIIVMQGMDLTPEEIQEMRAYAPPGTDTRIILGLGAPINGKPTYIGSPMDTTLSAVELFGNLLAGNAAQLIQGMVRPETKMIFDVNNDRDLEEIPAEHIAALKAIAAVTPGVELDDLVSFLVTPIARVAKGDYDSVLPVADANGNVKYPLVDPVQQKVYTDRIAVLNYLGLLRVVNDYANSFRATGTKVDLAEVDPLLYAINLNTPLKGQSPMMQRAKNVMMLDKEAASWARDLSDKAIADVKASTVSAPQSKAQAEGKQVKAMTREIKKAEKITGVSDPRAEKKAVNKQKLQLVQRKRKGEITKEEFRAEMDKLQERGRQLQVEIDALEAAGK